MLNDTSVLCHCRCCKVSNPAGPAVTRPVRNPMTMVLVPLLAIDNLLLMCQREPTLMRDSAHYPATSPSRGPCNMLHARIFHSARTRNRLLLTRHRELATASTTLADGHACPSISAVTLIPSTKLTKLMGTLFSALPRCNNVTCDSAPACLGRNRRVTRRPSLHFYSIHLLSNKRAFLLSNQQHHQKLLDTLSRYLTGTKIARGTTNRETR